MRRPPVPLRVAMVVGACAACAPTLPGPSAPPGVVISSITVTSRSFPSNGPIPVDYTCDGKDVPPQLTFSAPPERSQSLVLVVDDPDASGTAFTHWVVWQIPKETSLLAEGVDPVSVGARVGVNDFGNARYGGPCPPKMQIHRYRFHLYALDVTLDLPDGADRARVDAAMNGHVLGEGVLYGTFSH